MASKLDNPTAATRWQTVMAILAVIGPGIITANVDNDAGGITTYSLAGAQFVLGGHGPLSLSLNQGGGFACTRGDGGRPDIQLYFQALSTMTARAGTCRPLMSMRSVPSSGATVGADGAISRSYCSNSKRISAAAWRRSCCALTTQPAGMRLPAISRSREAGSYSP